LKEASAFKAPQGLLKYIVLAYSSKYPVSGSEMADDIREKTSGQWDPSPGSVYYLMNELKGKGLIVPVKGAGRGRKAYIASEEGRAELARASRGLMGSLQREVTLLALLVSMVEPASSERMEVVKRALKADAAQVSKALGQMK